MTAGPDLDKLLADLIGWEPHIRQILNADGNYEEPTPQWSTDIAAAWTLVGQYASEGFTLEYHDGYIDGNGWYCRIMGAESRGATAPMAIVLAILKARQSR